MKTADPIRIWTVVRHPAEIWCAYEEPTAYHFDDEETYTVRASSEEQAIVFAKAKRFREQHEAFGDAEPEDTINPGLR